MEKGIQDKQGRDALGIGEALYFWWARWLVPTGSVCACEFVTRP